MAYKSQKICQPISGIITIGLLVAFPKIYWTKQILDTQPRKLILISYLLLLFFFLYYFLSVEIPKNENISWDIKIGKRSRYFILGVLFLLAGIYSYQIYAPSDDAFIFLVYAKNFINGNGLTFNGAIVEGFSSPLWVALLSLFGLTGIPLPLLALILSALSGLLAIVSTYLLANKFLPETSWAILAPLILISSGDFTFYMGVGLEQILFTGLVAIGTAHLIEDPEQALRSYKLPILLALTILTRPEGALICAALLLWTVYLTRSKSLPFLCGLRLTFLLTPVMIIKRLYYGYWFPNTYYVKSQAGFANLDHGIKYLYLNAPHFLIVFLLFAIFLIFSLKLKRLEGFKKAAPLLLICLVWIGYMILNGGDNLVGARLFVPILPLLYIALLIIVRENLPSFRSAILVSTIAVTGLLSGYIQDPNTQAHAERWRRGFLVRQKAGLYLKDNFSSETLVALNPTGVIPYFSELPTIDMLGLNDIYIAHQGKRDHSLPFGHQAGDGEYVLSLEPVVILFGGGVSKNPGGFISDREIWESDVFQTTYQLKTWPGIGYAYVRIK